MTLPAPPTEVDVEALYRSEWRDLVRLAAVVSGDAEAAPDLVQDVFGDLARDGARVHNPSGWLRTAVAHRATSWARRRGSARRYLERYGSAEPQADGTSALQDRRDVRDSLAVLTPAQRAVVFCRYYLDLTEADTAATLGCRPGTVKSRLARAHRRLQEELDDSGH